MFFYIESLFELFEGDLLNHNYYCNFSKGGRKTQFLSWGYCQKGSGIGCMEKPASRVGSLTKHFTLPTLNVSTALNSTISVLFFLFINYLYNLTIPVFELL